MCVCCQSCTGGSALRGLQQLQQSRTSCDSPALPDLSWSRGKAEPSQPHKDDVSSPTAAVQGCEPGEMGILPALLSIHLLHRQDKQEKSCLILQDTEGGAGSQQTKTKRLMTQKKEAEQGAEHGSLGAIRPPGGVSSLTLQLNTYFSSVYAHLSLPMPLCFARASPSQSSPNVQLIPGAARGRTGLALMLSRQVSTDGTTAPPGE